MGQNNSCEATKKAEPVADPKHLFRSERLVKKPKEKGGSSEIPVDLFKSERVVKNGQPVVEFKKKEGFFNKESF